MQKTPARENEDWVDISPCLTLEKGSAAYYTNNMPVVLQVKDLMSLLSISHNTAYTLVRSGKIRSIRVGRTYRIPRDAITEYLCKC